MKKRLIEIQIEPGIHMHLPAELERVFEDFEPLSVAKMKASLREGQVVVDVGANFGYYSLLASRAVGPSGQVYAFEPSPATLKILRLNTQRYDNVYIADKAVSDTCGQIRFFHTDDYVNSGTVANPPFKKSDEVEEIMVQAISLDEYFPKNFEVDFLKIDIQGDDLRAIKGAKGLIQRSQKIKVLVEWAPTWMKNAGIQADELPKLLIEFGFDKLSVVDDYLKETYSVEKFLDIVKYDGSGRRFCNLLAERTR